MKLDLRVYAVTDRTWTGKRTLLEQLEEALLAGATMVQLREKHMNPKMFLEEAVRVKELTDQYGVPLIINDNVDIAVESGAAGVHVGQTDLDAAAVREILGLGKILGVTAKTVEQARRAQAAGVDYLGSGAVFGSTTKADAMPMELGMLRKIAEAVEIPVVAIGGINRGNAAQLAGTGIAGFAVVSGIFGEWDIGGAVKDLLRAADRLERRKMKA